MFGVSFLGRGGKGGRGGEGWGLGGGGFGGLEGFSHPKITLLCMEFFTRVPATLTPKP